MKKKKFKRRFISFLTASVLMANILPLDELPKDLFSLPVSSDLGVSAASTNDFNSGRVVIASHARLNEYCEFYAANTNNFAQDHQNDTLVLTFASEVSENQNKLLDDFPGLGNSEYPFDGTIQFSLSGSGKDLSISKAPFFTHVRASVQIQYDVNQSQIELRIKRVTAESGTYTSAPLFAEHVYPCSEGKSPANWTITDDASETYYAGVIGKIHEDAVVDLKFSKNSTQNIENHASDDVTDVGALCGSMETGSSLTAEFSESSSSYTIKSKNGNAGGLVGTMDGTASITLKEIPEAVSGKTVESEAANGYAGGLAGKVSSSASIEPVSSGFMIGGAAASNSVIPVAGNVKAANAAGGVFGCYTNTLETNSFDVNKYSISTAVYGKYCGGVFGALENKKDSETNARVMSISNISSLSTTSGSGSDFDTRGYFGGLIGRYTTDDLVNTLELSNITYNTESRDSFAAFGGAIGIIDSKAYIKADNVNITAKGTNNRTAADDNGNYAYFGGLVGATSASQGVMIDLGSFELSARNGSSAENFRGGGVVGQFYNGVLRLSGTTNLSGAKPQGTYAASSDTAMIESCYGQLVGYNDNVLVYALGSGSDSDPAAFESTTSPDKTVGWRYQRSNSAVSDDLGTWGQVVRLFGSNKNAEAAGIVNYDSSAHTVTLAAAVPAMSNNTDFAKTALNIMLNDNNSGYDCLLFTGNGRDSLLSGTLSLSADISLAGTGITGLTRDGSANSSDPASDIGTVTGTFSGGSRNITFATGETYGVGASGQTEGMGQIYRHKFTGLFAYIGNGTIQSLATSGNIYVRNAGPLGMSIGGAAARTSGSTVLNGITANQTVNYYEGREALGAYIGGLLGHADNTADNGIVQIKGTTNIDPTFVFSGTLGNEVCCGGAIGSISSSKIIVDIGQNSGDAITVTASTDVNNVSTKGSAIRMGGLIGYIDSNGRFSDKHVNINNTFFGTTSKACTINNPSTEKAGGLFGYAWYHTNVVIEGITVNNAVLNVTAPMVGIMAFEATGKWQVDSLAMNKFSMSGGGNSSLGVLVNCAFSDANGLYLDVLSSGYVLNDYALSTGSGVKLPDSLSVYDELAAYSASNAPAVLTGKAGVISVNTNGRSSNDPTITATNSKGTYQNQLTSASSSALGNTKYANQYSRYYYNLDIMKENSSRSGGEKLVLWSVHNYAADNINGEFPENTSPLNSNTTVDIDLTGLSFYPVSEAGNSTLSNVNITFDYSGIYEAETNNTLDTDRYTRDPGASSTARNQHYLMQSGLFMKQTQIANQDVTLTLAGTVRLGGTFLETSSYKGVLISQTMKGSLNTTGSIILDNLTPKTTGNNSYADDGYLLVNNIVTDTSINMKPPVITIKNLSTTNYPNDTNDPTVAVARSLFGTASGTGLTITFDNIKLDARTTVEVSNDMTTAYGTSRSIFSQATFFDSIYTDKDASLIYNYTHDEDWGTDTPREVTYGKEITSSTEYHNKEKKYFESQIYTNPTNVNEEYDFATNGFLPYVRHAYTAPAADAAQYYREIKVNVQGEEMGSGCGTYNDPYVITSGAQLEAIAKFLNDHKATDISQINLPNTPKNGVEENASGDRWCSSNHAAYTPSSDNSKFTSTTPGAAEWTAENAALYLTSAYYQIGDPNASTPVTGISLSSNYVGLGTTTDTTESGKDAFRGVIVGAKDSSTNAPTITITNASENPLIKVSNGSVVKNLNIVNTKSTISLEQGNNSSTNAYFGYNYAVNSNCTYYGGIIGEIMGGDNIIDNSYVNFSGSTVKLSGNNGTLVPVGGYVGVVVYGALIFKNMTQTVSGSGALRVNNSGLTVYYGNNTENIADSSSSAYESDIYANPIVGRVINGYAVNETADRFSVTEDGTYHDDANNGAGTARTAADGSPLSQHTLKNGKKHYSIADIKRETNVTAANSLSVSAPTNATTGDGTITVPNAQALFILSLITQSGAGTATSGDGDYANSLSYGIYDTIVHGMSRNASYDDVGKFGIVSSNEDYALTSFDTAAKTAVPYIIKNYSTSFNQYKIIKQYKIKSPKLGNVYIDLSRPFTGARPGFHNTSNASTASVITFTSTNDGASWILSYDTGNGIKYLRTTSGNGLVLGDSPQSFAIHDVSGSPGNSYIVSGSQYINGRTGSNNGFVSSTSNDSGSYMVLEQQGETSIINIGATCSSRCVTTTAGYYNINLTADVDYTLPDSYRGLGCVGIYDSKTGKDNEFCMKVNKFDGKGCTIDEDIYINRRLNDNYFDVMHNGSSHSLAVANNAKVLYKGNGTGGKGLAENHGIGLFDSVIMKYDNDNNANVLSYTDSEIGNFTLTGSVNTEVFNDDYNAVSKEWKEVSSLGDAQMTQSLWLSAGGVCGWSTNGTYVVFSKIALNSLRVRGSNFLGGLLGFSGIGSATVKVIVKECSANDISVEMNAANQVGASTTQPRSAIGAFVGKVQEGAVVIYGTSSGENNTDLTKKSTVTIRSLGFADNNLQYFASTGGLVGFAGHCCQVYDMTVTSGSDGTVTIGNSNVRFSGGLVGAMQSFDQQTSGNNATTAIARFRNCTVQNMNVAGEFAGGFYGGKWDSLYTPYIIELENCKMEGRSTGEKNTITATKINNNACAGGFIGRGIVKTSAATGNSNITISNCKVSNYSITAVGGESDADKGVAGGFVGYCQSFNGGSTITCYIHDSSVENSVIGAAGAFSFGGGAIGWVNPKDTSKENKMLGYNIKLDNVSTNSEDKANMGAWVGYLGKNDKKTSIRFNGIAIYGTGYEKNIGNWTVTENQANTNTSFIFADYTGACESITTPSQVHTSGYNYENNVNSGTPTYPYVNVNPHQTMGTDGTTTEYISSDAAVLYDTDNTKNSFSEVTGTAKDTMAAKVYHDLVQTDTNADNYSRRYTTFDKDALIKPDGSKKIKDYLNGDVAENEDRISTYSTERSGLPQGYTGNDFAVVVISNTDDVETTGLINRYIQLMTNTATVNNYAAEDVYYEVKISACKYSGGKFSIDDNLAAGLTTENDQFKLVGSSADGNRRDTFTLLDVQFKDPLNSQKVAYHLYVPVFTKKQINFGFKASALSDTNSVKYSDTVVNDYETAFSNTPNVSGLLIDGLDSWYTQYIRFTYDAVDLNILLASNSVNWNHDKYVEFQTIRGANKLPTDTYMILVDPNGGRDKVYYGDLDNFDELTSVDGGWKIELNKFTKTSAGSDHFDEVSLNEQIAKDIEEVDANNEGMFNRSNGTGDVYRIDSTGTPVYYTYVSNGTGQYDLKVNDSYVLNEDYYLSMYVPMHEETEGSGVEEVQVYGYTINSPESLEGSFVAKKDSTKIYPYNVIIADLYEQETAFEVSTPEHQLEITENNKKLTVTATSTIKIKNAAIKSYLNDKNLYHGFDLTLDRYEEGGNVLSKIMGLDPENITAKYRIQNGDEKACEIVMGENDIMFKTEDILSQLMTTDIQDGLTITAEIEMDFTDIVAAFPEKTTTNPRIGTNVAATSKLSYDQNGLAGSSISEAFPENNNFYYREALSAARLTYEADDELDSYDMYGYESKNYSRLGVNGEKRKNSSADPSKPVYLPIHSTALFNASSIEDYDFNKTKTVRFTLRLFKKTDYTENGSVTKADYGNALVLADYLDAENITISIGDTALTKNNLASTATEYSFDTPVYTTETLPEDKRFIANLLYSVKTGTNFHEYANYRVELQAELLDESNNTLGNKPNDYIVYTNAKVYPTLIENIGGGG